MELNYVLEQSGNLNYGIIGNCKSSALIYEDSSIDWCCLPQFDSPSVFGKILDKNIGGGLGIMIDDVVAGLAAAAVIALLQSTSLL